MTVRHRTWTPGDQLKATDMNDLANNGAVQVDTIAELATLFSTQANVNVAFCLEDMQIYTRGASEFVIATLGSVSYAVFDEGSSTGATFSTLTNPDGDDIDYRLATFDVVGAATLAVQDEGLVEITAVGGGANGSSGGGFIAGGGGGDVRYGTYNLTAGTHNIQVGQGNVGNIVGTAASYVENVLYSGGGKSGSYASGPPGASNVASAGSGALGGQGATVWGIGTSSAIGGGAGGTLYGAGANSGVPSSITGTSVEYGMGGSSGVLANYGNGGYSPAAGQQGVVYVRTRL